jgi:hypothetical protein
MLTVVDENSKQKIIKHVTTTRGKLVYVSYCFLWRGPFRLIYRNTDPAEFTAWRLNRETGIWGCFADHADIGFDYMELFEEIVSSTPNEKRSSSMEVTEDQICARFFDRMTTHIAQLFPTGF